MKKYQQLFRIDFKHSYFSDDLLHDFIVEPTPSTQQLMQQYDLRLQKDKKEITIHCGVQDGESMDTVFGKAENLCFLLKVQDPYFINYTDLSLLGQEGKQYFFSNINPEQETALAIKPLQKKAFVSEQDGLPFHPLFYQHQLPMGTEKAQFSLRGSGQNAMDQDQLADWQFTSDYT